MMVTLLAAGHYPIVMDDEDDDFDYDEFIEENFSSGLTNTQTRPLWRLVAVILLALIVIFFLFQLSAVF